MTTTTSSRPSAPRPYEVHDFITFAVNHYHVDPAKVYVTGLSCGAYGLWEYLSLYGNQQVAAAVPVAGYGLPAWQHGPLRPRLGAHLGVPR